MGFSSNGPDGFVAPPLQNSARTCIDRRAKTHSPNRSGVFLRAGCTVQQDELLYVPGTSGTPLSHIALMTLGGNRDEADYQRDRHSRGAYLMVCGLPFGAGTFQFSPEEMADLMVYLETLRENR